MIKHFIFLLAPRFPYLVAAFSVIFMGLMLRGYGYGIGLPFVVVKYGGSILWGSMVYLFIGAAFPDRSRPLAVPVTGALAIIVELIRLVHFPALDAFRATTAGALLLGRVFSLWNIACYLAGIWVAFAICGLARRRG